MTMKNGSTLNITFKRDGKTYKAHFAAKREKTPTSYSLHGEIESEKGKKIFEKDRFGLDYSQLQPAMIFIFHQAFNRDLGS